MNTILLDEPSLFFQNNEKCIDPQIGILNFGPWGSNQKQTESMIKAGIIGTEKSISETENWLKQLHHRLETTKIRKGEYQEIPFPGLGEKGPLQFDITFDKNCYFVIDRKFIRNLKTMDRIDRIYETAKLYEEKLKATREIHPQPLLFLLPLDDELIKYCKDPSLKSQKIICKRRDFKDDVFNIVPFFDFHNFIKAKAAQNNIITQIIDPRTLSFSEAKQSPSTIAWNFSVATYYKATGIPWKLSDIDDKTCYIGIGFYHDINKNIKTMRASIAQVYMRTGESQVIRGQPFDWDENELGRSIRLSDVQMNKIISDSINIFKTQRGYMPDRVVIHKKSRFSDEELDGCKKASESVNKLDVVYIDDDVSFRAYHRKYDYPIVRGTLIYQNNEGFLFTVGFIPALGTYPGPSAPQPLHILCQHIDTSIETICKDILGLTKLDWNSSSFCTRLPVTISVSKKVGEVMAEMVLEAPENLPRLYKFFM